MKDMVINQMVADGAASKKAANEAVEAVFRAVHAVLRRGEDVRIPQFGTFKRKFREGRTGCNPRTGETVQIAGRHVIAFKQTKGA